MRSVYMQYQCYQQSDVIILANGVLLWTQYTVDHRAKIIKKFWAEWLIALLETF